MRIAILWNPVAGPARRRPDLKTAVARLTGHGHQVVVLESRSSTHAVSMIVEAAPGFDVIAAAGGDGTVNDVATGLLSAGRGDVPIGILPCGTGNDLAQAVGLESWSAGLAALMEPAERQLDCCRVEYTGAAGRPAISYSLLWSGAGFSAEVIRATTPLRKRLLGRWAYFYSAFTTAFRYRCPEMQLETDGEERGGCWVMAAVANVAAVGGQSMLVAPGARADDGLLQAILIREARPLRILACLHHLAAGTHLDLPEVDYLPVRRLEVRSAEPVLQMVDGDVMGTTPVTYEVLPRALKVLTPVWRGDRQASPGDSS